MTSDDELPTLPNYTLISVLGQGAGGVVYRAFRSDGSSDRPLALKILRTRFGEDAKSSRGWRELRILESLRLPCVPRLLDYGMALSHT